MTSKPPREIAALTSYVFFIIGLGLAAASFEGYFPVLLRLLRGQSITKLDFLWLMFFQVTPLFFLEGIWLLACKPAARPLGLALVAVVLLAIAGISIVLTIEETNPKYAGLVVTSIPFISLGTWMASASMKRMLENDESI